MCFYCGGNMISSFTTYSVSLKSCRIIIKNVPCEQCEQCNEKTFSDTTMQQLDAFIRAKKNTLHGTFVTDYSDIS